jgi:hypothetical protein
MEEELREPREHADVLVGEVISEGLTIELITQDADQTEPIHSPLLHPLAFLSHTHLPQHPRQLPTSQFDHTRIIQLPQLLLQSDYQFLRDVYGTLIQDLTLNLIPPLHGMLAILRNL